VEPSREHLHASGQSLWPAGFAVGVVALLVGFVVAWPVVAVGAVIAVVFAGLWVRDLGRQRALTAVPVVAPETRAGRVSAEPAVPAVAHGVNRYPRNVFLEVSTLGLGGVIGGLVTLPILGFMIGPAFLKQGVKPHDLGPLANFPEGEYVITTFTSDPAEGVVSRRTAFVRNNGLLGNLPSFTILSNRCVHLGCPVEPNGVISKSVKHYKDVALTGVNPSGFGCPCHDSQYDDEGNRTAGPAVRALDRYSFSIVNEHLFVGAPFAVSFVTGTGAQAKIHETGYAFPGEPVTGIESWLYPIQPPH
jgi:Rieske Fe-S protein